MTILSKNALLVLLSIVCISPSIQAMKLIDAVRANNIQRVQELINTGINVNFLNEYGWTALMWAAAYHRIRIAELLIKHGAEVNTQAKDDGWTALMCAAENGHTDMVGLLLKYGADITIKNKKGKAALDIAKSMFTNQYISQKEIGKILLEAYIEQRKKARMKSAESRAILESKKEEVRQLVAQYPGIPAQDIIKHLKV